MITQLARNNISIIIPTYNRREVLSRAVSSVLRQTYPIAEVIVIDDASGFDTTVYLKEQFANEHRVYVIRNERNMGGGYSRNIGAEYAKGKFIAFLDSDDYWIPEKLEKQMLLFDKDKNLGLAYCDNFLVSEDGEHLRSGTVLFDQDILEHLLNGWVPTNTSNLIFRKNVFDELGGFDCRLASCQDHDLWMRVGLMGVKVNYINEPLSVVTNDANNRITRGYNQRAKGVREFLAKWKKNIIKAKGKKHFWRFSNQYAVRTLFSIFIAQIKNLNLKNFISLYFVFFVLNPFFYSKLYPVFMETISKRTGLRKILKFKNTIKRL